MVARDDYLKLAWRGKSVFTPGTGNSQGCITLTNADVNIEHIHHLGNRGHYFTYSSQMVDITVVMNIYAPNGFNDAKTDFYNDVFNTLGNYDCDVILGGDMNVTLCDADRHRRGVTPAETQLAEMIKDYVELLELKDVWQGHRGYTWHKEQKQSKLDRIWYRLASYEIKTTKIDWTIAKSDHAAVITSFKHMSIKTFVNSHVKLDNELLKNNETLLELRSYLIAQLNDPQVTGFNPHNKLEFAKMTIRTKALDIMARNKKKANDILKGINRDIVTNTRLLSIENNELLRNILIRELDQLQLQRDEIVDAQGERLAQFAKTKWYNEGKKSNKYFLNMLKRQTLRGEMDTLVINGVETSDKSLIETHVQLFYQQLYSHGRTTNVDDTFFNQMFTVDNEHNEQINAEITLNELWLTLKGLKATTPGPDGISNAYLKKLFDIIGPLILDAWNYSTENNELMVSHQRSYLHLIPKPGKDKKELKNWRPITLSNCDHKLITKTYNNRLLKIITDYITPTQTAYIKGRNIADNLRLLNALTTNCNFNMDINSSVVALDAQKAFDSVNHKYIAQVLEKIGLTNFIPIFKLLYKNLTNDILINGQASIGFKIENGVKQGDALSCSLFILAIEPVLRNLQVNSDIQAITCNRLNFTWPKVLAYADDISVITQNSHHSVQAIFTEYDRLSKASGLFLNADKTELFNVTSPNTFAMQMHSIIYNNQNYNIQNATSVKINGIIFNMDKEQMANDNFDSLTQKMHKHFTDWSKRNLSILGKIQIIKTFGISQYLYSLAVIEFTQVQWKEINKLVAKFIWNKNYAGNRAPNRLSNDTLFKPVECGGFGMLQIDKVTCGLRLRRFSYLLERDNHPINQLQNKLGGNEFLRATPIIDIDATTTTSLLRISEHNLKCLQNYDLDELETDRLLRLKLCNVKISNIVQKQKRNNPLLARLRHQDVYTSMMLF
jgi:hypothetical protein